MWGALKGGNGEQQKIEKVCRRRQSGGEYRNGEPVRETAPGPAEHYGLDRHGRSGIHWRRRRNSTGKPRGPEPDILCFASFAR